MVPSYADYCTSFVLGVPDLAPLVWTQVCSITFPICTAISIAYGPPMAENKIDVTVNG